MPVQWQGASGSVVEAGAFAAEGLHVISKPQDYGALGHYAMVLTTGGGGESKARREQRRAHPGA